MMSHNGHWGDDTLNVAVWFNIVTALILINLTVILNWCLTWAAAVADGPGVCSGEPTRNMLSRRKTWRNQMCFRSHTVRNSFFPWLNNVISRFKFLQVHRPKLETTSGRIVLPVPSNKSCHVNVTMTSCRNCTTCSDMLANLANRFANLADGLIAVNKKKIQRRQIHFNHTMHHCFCDPNRPNLLY